jgi:hypothetical protein
VKQESRSLTVKDLRDEMARLCDTGHAMKEIGFPEGIHSSRFVVAEVEENPDSTDGHPGFVWLKVE